MIACYLELYEEGEVEHINGPTHPYPSWFAFKGRGVTTRLGIYRAAFCTCASHFRFALFKLYNQKL